MADMAIHELGKTGQKVCLVPRSLMKAPGGAKKLKAPGAKGKELPPAPPTLDLSKGGQIKLPMLGNDRVGDCYLVDAYHQAQLWSGQNGRELVANADQVVDEYFDLTGGRDVGLYTDQLMDHFRDGLQQGGTTIEDWAVVPFNDPDFLRRVVNGFGGASFTFAIPDRWLDLFEPGAVIDAGRRDRPNPYNGHAMTVIGYDPSKGFHFATWGYSVFLTQRALGVCDAEFIAWVSKAWVPKGKAPNGISRADLVACWEEIGGEVVDLGGDDPEPPEPDRESITVPPGDYLASLEPDGLSFRPMQDDKPAPQLHDLVGKLDLLQLVELLELIASLIEQLFGKQLQQNRMTGGVRDRDESAPHPVSEGKENEPHRTGQGDPESSGDRSNGKGRDEERAAGGRGADSGRPGSPGVPVEANPPLPPGPTRPARRR